MAYISEGLRQGVRERAHERCEYCQTQQVIVVSMEIDHIVPESAGGETALGNLCLACVGCNGFKLDFQRGIDPETGQEAPLFNPRVQGWNDHFQWRDDGLQVIGRATVVRLRMNRDAVVNSRQRWVQAGWHPPKE
ncbi:MAG: HNH endonuclease [Anaerolineae bacterium]|nr:HNH endonuclease [Anaerolineae bacterium]